MSATLVRSTIWPAWVVALGPSQAAQLAADRAELRGRQQTRTTARSGGRNAGTVSRDRSALQRLGLMLRMTTRGRAGGTVIYQPSSAGAPPRLARHLWTLARMGVTRAAIIGNGRRGGTPTVSAPIGRADAAYALPLPLALSEGPAMPRLTFAQRMAAAGLDFAAIGVQAPEGVTLPLPELAPAQAPAQGPSATVTCSDYRAHQSAHHYTPAGWLCDLCVLPW